MDQFFSQISFVDIFNFCVFLTFSICYTYQLYYVLVVLTRKPKKRTARKNHRFAVVVSARNEREVIGDLIHSIKVQNYPQELIDVFVIADNCTDDTAEVAREAGATVFPRHNDKEVGKGYALDYGFQVIREQYSDCGYEAYFVFDADNVLDVNYFREMNATFDAGAKASTSYRNSKNYDSNWISAGYAVWFLREAKFLNQARLTLNTSCAVSGTGFFISSDIIEKNGGWKWHLLTEDIEFSANSILEGVRISYTPTAVLYDEQPITFRDSWNQRFRWAKGFYQVFWHYGAKLAKGIFTNPKGARFACYDMLMTIAVSYTHLERSQSFANAKAHFRTITRHKMEVMRNCFAVGLYKQGLLHDLSKYAPVEFAAGVRYYQGTRSPNAAERDALGYSAAWLHHKGRNRHHYEYWVDIRNSQDGTLEGKPMSTRYVVEMFCDRVAACKVYELCIRDSA